MTDALLWVVAIFPAVLILLMIGAWLYGYCWPERVPMVSDERSKGFPLISGPDVVAVLIACRNGESTIASTIESARRNGCSVYVVNDASTDATVQVAVHAGANVLDLKDNVGKPAALLQGYEFFDLGSRYPAVAILDDDVEIADDFVERCLEQFGPDTAIVVGKNLTKWPRTRRWNIWLAKRAFSYWNYQLIIRRLQSAFGVMSCISGSNSVYRTELLDLLLPVPPPYIVDDTYWVLETQRRGLGEIVYAPKARALLQDPTNLHDWYHQNLRWLWGTFQGILGHRVGRVRSRFDVAYVVLMIQWFVYVAGTPLTLWVAYLAVSKSPALAVLFIGLYCLWICAAAIMLGHPQLVILAPVIIVIDLLYRVIFIHALIKAIRQPTVTSCKWESPARFATNSSPANAAP